MTVERMCAVCRSRKEKTSLIRIAKSKENGVVIDKDGRSFGRGLYICKKGECALNAKKRRVLERGFGITEDKAVEIYKEIESIQAD